MRSNIVRMQRVLMRIISRQSKEELEYKGWLEARDRDYAKKKASLHTENDFSAWMASWDADIDISRDDYFRVRTSHWTKKATDRLVELPPRNIDDRSGEGYWERSRFGPGEFLTDKGVAYIRKAVREEQRESWEMRFRVASGLFSASALVISIVSILRSG